MTNAPVTPTAVPAAPPRHLAMSLWAVVVAVLTQAALAGLFLSGATGARLVHTVVGWVLPWAALVVAAMVGASHRRGSCPPRLALAVYPLPVLLWVQETLGHVPAAATTAIHVPLGVALAVHSAVLAVLFTSRRAPAASPRRDACESAPGRAGPADAGGVTMRTVVAVAVGLVVGAVAGVALNQVLGVAGLVLMGDAGRLPALRLVPAVTAAIGAVVAVTLARR